MIFKIFSLVIIIMAFHEANSLTPPSVRELKQGYSIKSDLQERMQITETKIILTPERGRQEMRFSIWMPSRPIQGDDFILISRPLILTYENITSAFELLKAN